MKQSKNEKSNKLSPQKASKVIEKLLKDNALSLHTVYDGFVYVTDILDEEGNRAEIEYL